MASLWGSLATFAKRILRAGGSRFAGQTTSPEGIRSFQRGVQRMTQGWPTMQRQRPRPIAPANWGPLPPGPALEPPVIRVNVPTAPEPVVAQPPGRDLADLRKDLDRPLSEESAEAILQRIDVLTHLLQRGRLTQRQRDVLDQLQELLRKPRTVQVEDEGAETEEEEDDIKLLGRGIWGYESGSQASALIGQTIRTPDSSNVYSFVYLSAEETTAPGTMYSGSEAARKRLAELDAASGTQRTRMFGTARGGVLYVTFKFWAPKAAGTPRGTPNPKGSGPGPTYAYYDVPMEKFEQFSGAIGKSGKGAGSAVWDYLRVRGSHYGHQHAYRLVDGAYVASGGHRVQRGGVYVPRKVVKPKGETKKGTMIGGYATRALPAAGMGRRGAITSQLGVKTGAQRQHFNRLRRY